MKDLLKKLAKDMGWNSLGSIPVANEENTSLLKELEALMREKQVIEEENKDLKERCEKISEHVKSTELCVEQNLNLIHAYNSDGMREAHLLKIVERQEAKVIDDIRKLDEEYFEEELHMQTVQAELEKQRNIIKDKTERLKWAKNAMTIWQEAMEHSKTGFKLIEKYFKEDETVAKQKERELQSLQNDLIKERAELHETLELKKRLENDIDSLGKAFRLAHAERREMVNIWKSAVTQMANRERSIENGDDDLLQLRQQRKFTLAKLSAKNRALDDLLEEQKDIEFEIEEINKSVCKIKEESYILKSKLFTREKEIHVYQQDLQNLASDIERMRAESRLKQVEASKKQEKLDIIMDKNLKLEDRLKKFMDKSLNATTRLQMLEDMIAVEEKTIKQMNNETQALNELRYRLESQLEDVKSEAKQVEVKNDGTKAATITVGKNIKTLKTSMRRQNEILYNLSFKCIELERKITEAMGTTSDPEEEERKKQQLQKLEAEHARLLKKIHSTESINKKLEESMRQLTLVYNRDIDEVTKINSKIKDVQGYYEGGLKRLKECKHINQVLIVDLSLLKMKAHNFEEQIKKIEKGRISLNQNRSQMKVVIKERLKKLEVQMGVLNTKRRTLVEERSTLIADITDRKKHIEAMKTRFELTSKLLGTNEDGTLVTSTQLQIEAAQEKHILIEEGNSLNQKVITAEKDIKAMENTLVLMNLSNSNFRDSLQKGASTDKDVLKEELEKIRAISHNNAMEIQNIQDNIVKKEEQARILAAQLENLEAEMKRLSEEKATIEENFRKVNKECQHQKERMMRAERELQNAIKALKELPLGNENFNLIEREIYLQGLEERSSLILNTFVDVIHSDKDAAPVILNFFQEKKIQMPHHMQSTRSFQMLRRSNTSLTSSTSKDYALSITQSSGSDTERSSMSVATAKVSVHSLEFNP
ncbi:coiled-coil domain-containing protein 39 [Teleopsis dalmanni]|uniref:coiled-coil domain-containing protein 39 n=1 Tax=Teleopsis dalmanni TaxID=139649 RepID=UPI0018CCE7B5|nr:coiled-coil domain-containing protein 39 [Teleopsis dalmanni]